MGAWFSK